MVQDTLGRRKNLGIGHTISKGTFGRCIIAPRSTPDPLRNPDRTLVAGPPIALQIPEVSTRPIAMGIDDVTTPATSIDGVKQNLDNRTGTVPIVTAVPRRGRTETHTRTHQVFPVGQDGLDTLRMVIRLIGRLVVGLHVARTSHAATSGRRRPILVDMVRNPLTVRQIAGIALRPVITPGGIQCLIGTCGTITCQTFLGRIVPLENSVGTDALVQYSGQGSHLQVGLIGNEATAVTTTTCTGREGDHVTTFQLEGANLVVQLLLAQRVHETARILQTEVTARSTSIVLFAIDRKRLDTTCIRQDDSTLCIHLHLAVVAIHGLSTIDIDTVLEPVLDDQTGFDVFDDDYRVFGVGDVHLATPREGSGRGDDVIDIVAHRYFRSDLRHRGSRVGGPKYRQSGPKEHDCKDLFHGLSENNFLASLDDDTSRLS